MKRHRLDKEERGILDSIEEGKWELVKPKRSELAHYARIAKNTLRKDQRMNIRISKADMERIKMKAAQEGIRYQTLVSSVLHKYVSGASFSA